MMRLGMGLSVLCRSMTGLSLAVCVSLFIFFGILQIVRQWNSLVFALQVVVALVNCI